MTCRVRRAPLNGMNAGGAERTAGAQRCVARSSEFIRSRRNCIDTETRRRPENGGCAWSASAHASAVILWMGAERIGASVRSAPIKKPHLERTQIRPKRTLRSPAVSVSPCLRVDAVQRSSPNTNRRPTHLCTPAVRPCAPCVHAVRSLHALNGAKQRDVATQQPARSPDAWCARRAIGRRRWTRRGAARRRAGA